MGIIGNKNKEIQHIFCGFKVVGLERFRFKFYYNSLPLVPTGTPTTCLYCLVPNPIKKLANQKVRHHIHFDMTMQDIFLFFFFSEVKKAFLSLHAR